MKPNDRLVPNVLGQDGVAQFLTNEHGLVEKEASPHLFIHDYDKVPAVWLNYLAQDLMIQDFVVDGLSQASLRTLLKQANALNASRGTGWCVKTVLKAYNLFTDIHYWYQTQGKNGTFTLQAWSKADGSIRPVPSFDAELMKRLRYLISVTKRHSQHYDLKVGYRLPSLNIQTGSALITGRKIAVFPARLDDMTFTLTPKVYGALHTIKTITTGDA